MNLCMMSLTMNGYTPEEIVKTAVDCGMCAVDWITTHDRNPADLKRLCSDAGLRIAAHTPLNWKYIEGEPGWKDEFKISLENACLMGAPVMMVPPFALKKHPELSEGLKHWTDFYAWAAPLAEESNVILTVESTGFPYSPVTTGEEVLEVLKNVPSLRVTFDNGNTATACDQIEAYRQLAPYIVRFHLKDWKIFDKPHKGAEKKRDGRYFADAVIGEGDLDLRAFWNTVDAKAKQFTVNLETLDPTGKRKQPEVLRQVCGLLREW